MRAREDIIRALRCSATYNEAVNCTGCPYLMEETLTEDAAQIVGDKLWMSCDCDRMAIDAAEMLEVDTKTISALIEDRKYYMEKYEELKNQVPQYDYVPPEEGAEDDEA